MLDIFSKVLYTGLDVLVPIRRVCVNTSDAPWMNDHLKSLILKRRKPFTMATRSQCCTKSTEMLLIVKGNRVRVHFTSLISSTWRRIQRFGERRSNAYALSTQTRVTFLVIVILKELEILVTRILQTQSTTPFTHMAYLVCEHLVWEHFLLTNRLQALKEISTKHCPNLVSSCRKFDML